jgi:hypothetical protein
MNRARQADQEGRTVMLTLRNAVDQTRKVAVEVPAGSTVRDAAIEAGIAQGESFDVFTAEGRAVTRDPVDDHGEAVLYVGPQKVAGGAMQLDEEPTKAIQFVSVYDHQVRNDVVPGEGQTVRQAAEVAGLTPRDGSQWQVFDDLGVVVDEVPAADMVGEQLYVGPEAIEAGSSAVASAWWKTGLDNRELNLAKMQYPTLQSVRSHRLPNGNSGVVLLSMIGVEESAGGSKTEYEMILDFRNFPAESPLAFVKTPKCSLIRHCNIYRASRFSIAPSLAICAVCTGSGWSDIYDSLPKKREPRLGVFLNHLQSILSNPNPKDKARGVR